MNPDEPPPPLTIAESLLSPGVETLANIVSGDIVAADRRLFGDPTMLAIGMTFTALRMAKRIAEREGFDLVVWMRHWSTEAAAAHAIDPDPPAGDGRWYSDYINVVHLEADGGGVGT